MISAREQVFIDNCAECHTKEDLIKVANACGFTWNEIANLSTRVDGMIGKKSHLFRQVRNSGRELMDAWENSNAMDKGERQMKVTAVIPAKR